MKNVLITGGNGLVGRHLCEKLKEKGFNVSILSTTRHKIDGITTFYWDIDKKEIEKRSFDNIDFVVHLAGANIGDKRWTIKRKKIIIDSRVKSAQIIFDVLKDTNKTLKAFISASAVGYYGAITTKKVFSETDPPLDDFLGQTCRLWEESADRFSGLGIRTVKIRTGLVLTKQGGALSRMITPIKFGIGSALANGKQYLPWIHVEDLCRIYIKAIEDPQMNGSYNAVAPDNRTNKEFTRALARTLNKPFWFPGIPAFILKLVYGEMADMLLKGSKVSCEKIKTMNFTFKFPDLENAFDDLFKFRK
jgi:uncharacterized protein (TIGR01777 family)